MRTGYWPATYSGERAVAMVSVTTVSLRGLSCTSFPWPCTHAAGIPSTLTRKWSTVAPKFASFTRTMAVSPGVIWSVCPSSTTTRIRPLSRAGGAACKGSLRKRVAAARRRDGRRWQTAREGGVIGSAGGGAGRDRVADTACPFDGCM